MILLLVSFASGMGAKPVRYLAVPQAAMPVFHDLYSVRMWDSPAEKIGCIVGVDVFFRLSPGRVVDARGLNFFPAQVLS